MRAQFVGPVLFLSVVCLAACSEPPPSGPHFQFSTDPASPDNPFPDVRLLDDGGGIDTSRRPDFYSRFLPREALRPESKAFLRKWAAALGEVKGFGNYAPILLPVSETLDPASLVDEQGRARVAFAFREGFGWKKGPAALPEVPPDPVLSAEGKPFLLVQPAEPLPAGQALLVVFDGVRTASGQKLVRDTAFRAWADEEGALLVAAAALTFGRNVDEVLFAMELRPAVVGKDLGAVRDWARSPLAPQPTIQIPPRLGAELKGVFRAGEDDLQQLFGRWLGSNAGHVGAVVLGKVGSRDFRANSVWNAAVLETPNSAPEVMLDFVLTLPASALDPAGNPLGGTQVVIGQHGINGRNSLVTSDGSFCLSLAEMLAAQGLGCIGIDAVGHGTRGTLTDFFVVSDLRGARDSFRQTYADQMQLVRAIGAMDIDGNGQPDLHSQPGYFGQSLGGIIGTAFAGLDDRISPTVLNVPGVGLTQILLSARTREMVGVLLSAESGIEYQSEAYYAMFPMLRALGQLILDEADPIHYAGLLSGRRVLVQEVKNDLTIPNATTRVLTRLAGLPELAGPLSDSAGTRGHFVFDMALADPEDDPHNMFWHLPRARAQAMTFLGSGGRELLAP